MIKKRIKSIDNYYLTILYKMINIIILLLINNKLYDLNIF